MFSLMLMLDGTLHYAFIHTLYTAAAVFPKPRSPFHVRFMRTERFSHDTRFASNLIHRFATLLDALTTQQPFSAFKFIRCCSRCVCVIIAIAVIIIISGYSDFKFHSYPNSWWDLWATSISPYNHHLVSQQWQQQQHPEIRERKMHFKLFKFPMHVHNIFYCVCFGIYPSLFIFLFRSPVTTSRVRARHVPYCREFLLQRQIVTLHSRSYRSRPPVD